MRRSTVSRLGNAAVMGPSALGLRTRSLSLNVARHALHHDQRGAFMPVSIFKLLGLAPRELRLRSLSHVGTLTTPKAPKAEPTVTGLACYARTAQFYAFT